MNKQAIFSATKAISGYLHSLHLSPALYLLGIDRYHYFSADTISSLSCRQISNILNKFPPTFSSDIQQRIKIQRLCLCLLPGVQGHPEPLSFESFVSGGQAAEPRAVPAVYGGGILFCHTPLVAALGQRAVGLLVNRPLHRAVIPGSLHPSAGKLGLPERLWVGGTG